jgi:predicted acylesterase/phospholipase RssA
MVLSSPKPQDRTGKLSPQSIRNLALEGGGGKGFAYLGALQVLEQLGITSRIEGYAGASAGAITAFLLSIGYNSQRLTEYLETTDFDSFFDSPARRAHPDAGIGLRLVEPRVNPDEARLMRMLDVASTAGSFARPVITLAMKILAPTVIEELSAKRAKQPFKVLFEHWKEYVTFLGRDMGLFDGGAARQQFDALIRVRMASVLPPGARNITFAEHQRFFQKKLLVTGSNLATGRTELFSAAETPDFPVADAIRISMSLPFIYKPYVITRSQPGWPPCGTYVDGGLWNNLPFREFDGQGGASLGGATEVRPQTLALRLAIDPVTPVKNFGDLLKRTATLGLFGTGESQVLSKYVNQTILLDTEGLDLVNFSPPKDLRDRAVKRARRSTWRYFDLPIPPEDEDAEDDARSAALVKQSRACG